MALISVVAGAYTGAYTPNASASGGGGGSASVGILTDSGWTLAWTIHKQRVAGTDKYGGTLLAGINQGADWSFRLVAREYSASVMNVSWPYGKVTGGGALSPVLAGIGREDTASYAGSLVLTSTAGTPAASNPATLTVGSCGVADGQNSSFEMTSRTREVPMHLVLYPYSTSISAVTYEVWFVCT